MTDVEIIERQERVCQLTAEYDSVELEKKDSNANFTSRLKHLRAMKTENATQANTGYEKRQVNCFEEMRFLEGKVILRRGDTGDAAEEREMTYEEKQAQLPLED